MQTYRDITTQLQRFLSTRYISLYTNKQENRIMYIYTHRITTLDAWHEVNRFVHFQCYVGMKGNLNV